jgi:hypothetical protein
VTLVRDLLPTIATPAEIVPGCGSAADTGVSVQAGCQIAA